MKLTYDEIKRIRYWKPYQDDWPFDGNETNLSDLPPHYDELPQRFANGGEYYINQTMNGGMGNFLEFVCYATKDPKGFKLPAILVWINLCAPGAVYFETTSTIGYGGGFSYNWPAAQSLYLIDAPELRLLPNHIHKVLRESEIELLDKEQLLEPMPRALLEGGYDNLLDSGKGLTLHAIFQFVD